MGRRDHLADWAAANSDEQKRHDKERRDVGRGLCELSTTNNVDDLLSCERKHDPCDSDGDLNRSPGGVISLASASPKPPQRAPLSPAARKADGWPRK
jgi:hypothetical protein